MKKDYNIQDLLGETEQKPQKEKPKIQENKVREGFGVGQIHEARDRSLWEVIKVAGEKITVQRLGTTTQSVLINGLIKPGYLNNADLIRRRR